ncbi:MAG TPA: thiamine phosphate synthase [Acidimicrobiales bacterium]|nr:thiamine phosphate synthase [Acidimicrobiales bacterium]
MAAGVERSTRLGRLHVIVDSVGLAEAALDGGAPVLQARLKGLTDRARYEVTVEIAELCAERGALCIVNDRVDVAVAVGAAGVHVGADDLPVDAVRRVVGEMFVVGGTARNPENARCVEAEGATYVGVGPTFATTSKTGLPSPLGVEGVRRVAEAVSIPVIAVAGITPRRVAEVLAAGAHGVAVIGAVANAADPRRATAELLAVIEEAVR